MQGDRNSDGDKEPAHTFSRRPPPRTHEASPGQAPPQALPAEVGRPRSQHAQHAQHTDQDHPAHATPTPHLGLHVYPEGVSNMQLSERASSVQPKPAPADREVSHADREVSLEAPGTLAASASSGPVQLAVRSGPMSRELGTSSVSSSSSGQPAAGLVPEGTSHIPHPGSLLAPKSSPERQSYMPGSSADMSTAHMHAHASKALAPMSAPADQPRGGRGCMSARARGQSMTRIVEGDGSNPVESAHPVPGVADHAQLSPPLQRSGDSTPASRGLPLAWWRTYHDTIEARSPFIGGSALVDASHKSTATSGAIPLGQAMQRMSDSGDQDPRERAAGSAHNGLHYRGAATGTGEESSSPPSTTAPDLPGARDPNPLEQKRIDNMTAEYTAVIASYEAARQAAHNRNAIFSGLMSAALAVSTDRQNADVRRFLGVCGVATCVYWFISLHRDHFMAVKRLNHGSNVENNLAIVFERCRLDALQAPPKYFEMLKEGNWYKAVAKDCQQCCCCNERSQCVGCTCMRRWCPACCGCPWFNGQSGHGDAGGTACTCMCRRCKCHGDRGCCRMWCFPAVGNIVLLVDVHFHFCLLAVFAVAWLYVLVSQPGHSQGTMNVAVPATPLVAP